MKLTKYGHACVMIENNKKRLIIDPGDFTELPEDLDDVVAVLLTHEHGDHTDPANIAIILAYNPNLVVYGTQGSIAALDALECKKIVIDEPTDAKLIDTVVHFQPTDHAVIWQKSPCKNIAIIVGDFFYYPGDSFEQSKAAVEIVGLSVSAPWLKLSEAFTFALDAQTKLIMPTHNGILNNLGHEIVHNWAIRVLEGTDKRLLLLQNGEEYRS